MWQFRISTGEVSDPEGEIVATGYSGFGPDKDQPADEAIPNLGPIPEGIWLIGPAETHAKLGEIVMALTPAARTVTDGRSGFYIHGDAKAHPGDASHGCIVLSRGARILIDSSDDKQLEVVA